jgi:hypothetical protein
MPNTYTDQLGDYYQIAEDAIPTGLEVVDTGLVDFATGSTLLDEETGTPLAGGNLVTIVPSSGPNVLPVVANGRQVVTVNVTNRQQSEVEATLLGIPRAEVALNLLGAVNIYGVNQKEWASGPAASLRYTYFSDPNEWTFRENYGTYLRHLPAESALQAYAFPPPVSFAYGEDDGTGVFPGGYTNGQATVFWETKRAFRYQPGRVTGFTFGVRTSTGSNHNGESVQWGCRNDYGDGYYFQLERGNNLFIIHRFFNAITSTIQETKIPRVEWNGDQVSIDQSATGWVLDLSKVTMFKIEFSWYGAVGARFYAYVPVGNDEARWVELHYVLIENSLLFPSLRSAYMKMFIQARTTAGTNSAAFVNLYGSSVYIDGGDRGTVTTGSAATLSPKNIDGQARSVLGLQSKAFINGIDNQKTVYPVTMSAMATVPARLDLVFQSNEVGAGESYLYGRGTRLERAISASLPVTRPSTNTLTGTFPDITGELSGPTNYSSGRRVRVVGSGIFNTHVIAINPGLTQITTDRPVPVGITSVQLSRLNAFAVASGVIPSGNTTASVYFDSPIGNFRIGLWPQSSGQPYTTNENVVWFAGRYTGLRYGADGSINGERRVPADPSRQANIEIDVGVTDTTVVFSSDDGNAAPLISGVTLTGVVDPWPISLVVEMMDTTQLDDVVITLGTREERLVPGSGTATAIAQWSSISGLTQDASQAGGLAYVANKFESSTSNPLSAVLVDQQGYRVLRNPELITSCFVGANQSRQFDLSNFFGPDKMFIAGKPGTAFNSGALFIVATSRDGTGSVDVTVNWEEQ